MGFKIGDVVHLISGSPDMTVTQAGVPKGKLYPRDEDHNIRCTWFANDDRVQSASFPPAALKRGPK